MASSVSTPQRFLPPTSSFNQGLVNQVLATKQAKLDYNKKIAYSTIDSVMGVELMRDQDKEHLQKNLETVIGTLENSDKIDFSKGDASYLLTNAIKSSIDDQTLQQISNTARFKDFRERMAEKEKDGKLNQTNYQDSIIQSGLQEYQNGQTDKLGSFDYVEYRDVQGLILEKAKDLKNLMPDREVSIKNGQGDVITKKIGALTQSEWQQIIPTFIDEEDRKQLAINGRVRFNYDNELAAASLQGERDNFLKVNTDKIGSIKAKMQLADKAKKIEYQAEIEGLTQRNKEITSRYNKIGNSAGQIGGYMLERQMIDTYSSQLSFEPYTTEIKSDTSYWKARKEAEDKVGDINSNIGNMDFNQDGVRDVNSVAIPTDIDDKINPSQIFNKQLKEKENRISVMANQVYSKLDPQQKESVDSYKKELISSGVSESDALRQTVTHFANSENPIMTLSEKSEMLKTINESESMYQAMSKASNAATQEIIDGATKVAYEELTKNDTGIKITGIGRDVTFNNFFKEKNINSAEEFKSYLSSESDEAKIIKANFLLAKGSSPTLLKQAASILGEDITPILEMRSKAFNRAVSIGPGQGMSSTVNTELSREEMKYKTFQILRERKNSWFQDTSLTEDGAIMKSLGQDYEKIYDRQLGLSSGSIAGMNAITIQPTLGVKNISRLNEELGTILPTMDFNPKKRTTMIPIGDGSYQVFQPGELDDDDNQLSGVVNIRDIENTEYLKNYIDFQGNSEAINFNVDRKINSGPLNYTKNTIKAEKELQAYYGPNSPISKMASSSYLSDLAGTPGLREEVSQTIRLVADNTNKFHTEFETSEGLAILNLYMEGVDQPIYTARPGDQALKENIMDISTTVPQVFISMAMQQLISQSTANNNTKLNAVRQGLGLN